MVILLPSSAGLKSNLFSEVPFLCTHEKIMTKVGLCLPHSYLPTSVATGSYPDIRSLFEPLAILVENWMRMAVTTLFILRMTS